MSRHFRTPARQQIYDLYRSTPSVPYPGRIGLESAYHAGRLSSDGKPRRTPRASLAYAAFAAGYDRTRAGR